MTHADAPQHGDAVAAVRRLRGVTWRWRDDAPPEARQQPGRGIIAQDVQAVFPHLVETTPDGHLRVDYGGLVPVLCRAVAELRERTGAVTGAMEPTGGTEMPDDAHAREVAGAAAGSSGTELDPETVRRVFPELVTTGEDGRPEVAHHGLVGPLIEAVKELDARLRALEDRMPAPDG